MQTTEKTKVTNLKDYTPPDFLIETVNLTFDLHEDYAQITARSQVVRNPKAVKADAPLSLDGEHMELISVRLNDKELSTEQYKITPEKLIIAKLPDKFDLEIITKIKPQENTALTGLYRSKNIFCTQCEAEGFRRITYYIDRPDVLSRFTTTIIADKTRYPIMLSNGNPSNKTDLENNRHSITWQDPFKKPAYLFALVAGDLDCLEDTFVTHSKRTVQLRVYVDKGQLDKAHFSMECVKKSMAWDEVAYGREYDLDMFMIVAIADFNMGAMENKGLNIFNAKYILADPKTATDVDYEGILLVVGHEYFHNWSGNRITCRDWFQLSLKEGLTVFREQEFTSDMTSAIVARINTVRELRNSQFIEDAGPLAHPVQPQSYLQINNFYTATVYNKGAEVIRMMKTLVGKELFRKGMDLYFARFDGNAVTIEDLISCIEQESGKNLKQFRLWYAQAGTPVLTAYSHYDEKQKTFDLTIMQNCAPTPGESLKKPFHIPVAVGLLDSSGNDMPLQLLGDKVVDGTTYVLELKQARQTFQFVNVEEKPLPSLLRGFSAPVKINYEYTDDELKFLLMHDSDGFNRWEAAQKLMSRIILGLVADQQNKKPMQLSKDTVMTFRELLVDKQLDKAFLVELLTLPSEAELGELMSVIAVDEIHLARKFIRKQLAEQLKDEFLTRYQEFAAEKNYHVDLESIAKRRLKNACLTYLMLLDDKSFVQQCVKQFNEANNMTDQIAALNALSNCDCTERETALSEFYNRFQHEALVVDKWFSIQARSVLPETFAHVKKLLNHSAFTIKNPNRARALIGAFCNENLVQFHHVNGEGYEFLADQVLLIDPLNPQLAARILRPLTTWQNHTPARQKQMRYQLERIANTKPISTDVYEIASKSLV